MKENIIYQYEHCKEYAEILKHMNFNPYDLNSYDDLHKIPYIQTLYLKKHHLFSIPKNRLLIKATSSGTSGKKSMIGYNFSSLNRGLRMILSLGKKHHLFSLKGYALLPLQAS